MLKKKYIIPIFIPHLGCPNDCVFCNQRIITKQLKPVKGDFVKNEINKYLNYFPQEAKDIEVAFYGGSFTGLDIDLIIEYLNNVKNYIDDKIVKSIRLSTRPDYIDDNILKLLKDYNVKTIELGVQSMVDRVLFANNRGNTSKDVIDAYDLLRKYDFNIGLQMMTGLYDSTPEDDIYSAKIIAKLKPDFVRIYPTMILPDTDLSLLYKKNIYKPMELKEMIDHVKNIVMIFEGNNINITRIGLPNTELDLDDNMKMIGPYHPALRQLIYSEIYFDAIKDILLDLDQGIDINLYANKSNISYLSGYNAINRKRITDLTKSRIYFKTKEIGDHIVLINQLNEYKIDIKKYCLDKIEEV